MILSGLRPYLCDWSIQRLLELKMKKCLLCPVQLNISIPFQVTELKLETVRNIFSFMYLKILEPAFGRYKTLTLDFVCHFLGFPFSPAFLCFEARGRNLSWHTRQNGLSFRLLWFWIPQQRLVDAESGEESITLNWVLCKDSFLQLRVCSELHSIFPGRLADWVFLLCFMRKHSLVGMAWRSAVHCFTAPWFHIKM